MRKGLVLPILAALSLVSSASCGDDNETADTSSAVVPECPADGCAIEETLRAPYTGEEIQRYFADVFAPVESGPWPVVVLTHGIYGSRSDVTPWAREVAAQGAVAVAVSYPDDPPFLEAVEHLGCAVRFARSLAPEHGGDPQDVTLVGHSLGAAMGAVVALDDEVTTDRCLAAEGLTAPEAFVGYEGPYDVATHDYQRVNITSLETEDPDVWQAVNPYTNVGDNPELVVRLIHGLDSDRAWYDVRPEVSEEFYETLLDVGYDVELVTIEGATHGGIGPDANAFDIMVAEIMEAARA